MVIVLFSCRHIFGYIFSNEEEVVNYIAEMIPLLCISLFMDSIQGVLSGQFPFPALTQRPCASCIVSNSFWRDSIENTPSNTVQIPSGTYVFFVLMIRCCKRDWVAAYWSICKSGCILPCRNSSSCSAVFCCKFEREGALDRDRVRY